MSVSDGVSTIRPGFFCPKGACSGSVRRDLFRGLIARWHRMDHAGQLHATPANTTVARTSAVAGSETPIPLNLKAIPAAI